MAAQTIGFAEGERRNGGRFDLFRSLRSRNYRLFFIGQTVSLTGTFLTHAATMWLVYHLTGSELLLGTVAFAGQLPLFFLAPFGGVMVDRWNKRNLLVFTQVLSGLQSGALALMAFWYPSVGGIIALAFVQGLINCLDMPARQAFLIDMVEDRNDLPNAIALNSTMVHAARVVGPLCGVFLIQFLSVGWAFSIDAVSYVAVVISLLMMNVAPHVAKERDQGVVDELKEGLRYAWDHVPIRTLLLLMAILSLTGVPAFNILLPVFAKELSQGTPLGDKGGALALGLLMAASAVGALTGAIYLASKRNVLGLGGLIAFAGVLFGAAIITFSVSRNLYLSALIAPLAGFGMLANFASANTLLQTLADDDKRGRVMSLFTVAFLGVAPFGNLLAGFLAEYLGHGIEGAARAVGLSGVIVLVSAGFFACLLPYLKQIVRPIYIKKGIITEVADGLRNAEAVTGGPAD